MFISKEEPWNDQIAPPRQTHMDRGCVYLMKGEMAQPEAPMKAKGKYLSVTGNATGSAFVVAGTKRRAPSTLVSKQNEQRQKFGPSRETNTVPEFLPQSPPVRARNKKCNRERSTAATRKRLTSGVPSVHELLTEQKPLRYRLVSCSPSNYHHGTSSVRNPNHPMNAQSHTLFQNPRHLLIESMGSRFRRQSRSHSCLHTYRQGAKRNAESRT